MIRAYLRWLLSVEGGMVMLLIIAAGQCAFFGGLLAGWWG